MVHWETVRCEFKETEGVGRQVWWLMPEIPGCERLEQREETQDQPPNQQDPATNKGRVDRHRDMNY